MEYYFDHEKLHVYQEAVAFVAWSDDLLRKCKGRCAAKGHLEEASTSAVLNIAEGNGKFYPKDRANYLQIARASALECAGSLDVLVVRRMASTEDILPGKERLRSVVRMLTALIIRFSDRVSEEEVDYGFGGPATGGADCGQGEEQEQEREQEQEHEQDEEDEDA